MNEKRGTWKARVVQATIKGLFAGAILYPLIIDLHQCSPIHADGNSVGEVVRYFSRLTLIILGAAGFVEMVFDWVGRLRRFMVLMRRQRGSMS
jgi:hypothetical protein